ncbi:MAG: hypothetical protein HXX11_04340 [Desulfuromonadales bacterium]|nr:hypothetical protein [Desulfuromonadales bacterium]
MLIHVMYPDKKYDYVKDFMLDTLIESEKITSFRRSSGWIALGVDPVRSRTSKMTHRDVERRQSLLNTH